MSTMFEAAVMQAPSVVRFAGSRTTSSRRLRVSSSSASALARPMWPWLARAAWAARSGVTPCRSTRNSATSADPGVTRLTCRVRERIVTSTSSGWGAHKIHTVRGVGSSIAFSSALPEWSLSRSASSTTVT
jgi:hypothetical protein